MTGNNSLIPRLLLAMLLAGCGAQREVVHDFAQLVESARIVQNPAVVDFDQRAVDLNLGSGWGAPEIHAGTGASFIWATAAEAELTMDAVGGEGFSLSLRCWPFTWEGAPQQTISIQINGLEVGTVELEDTGAVYSVALPPGAVNTGSNRIAFSFAYAERPRDYIEESDDRRRLGVAFDWLVITNGQPPEHPPKPEPDDVRVTETGFAVRPGTALFFTVLVPEEGSLQLGAKSIATGDCRARISIREVGDQPPCVLDIGAFTAEGSEQTVDLLPWVGARLEIGLVANDRPSASGDLLEWIRPRIHGIRATPEGHSNLLLIVADTLRADVLGCYGGSASTPNIDKLAESGARFEFAYSHIPITGPSHSSLFTSKLPTEHGVHNNTQILDQGALTLAELFREQGFETAAFISLGVLKRKFGFSQGFDVYDDDFGGSWTRTAEEVNSAAMPWVEAHESGPFFLWMHYSDPHEPYAPPGLEYRRVVMSGEQGRVRSFLADGREKSLRLELDPGVSRFDLAGEGESRRRVRFLHIASSGQASVEARFTSGWEVEEKRFGAPEYCSGLPAAVELVNDHSETVTVDFRFVCKEDLTIEEIGQRYIEEVEYLDLQLGRFLETLRHRGMLDNTLVVFVSDHGESVGEHNHVGHISQLYDTLIRVPLIVSLPKRISEATVVDSAVGLIDILPTVADLLGIAVPDGVSGRSLVELMDGRRRSSAVFAETFRPEAASDKKAVIQDGFKYIRSRTDHEWEELYAVRRDPGEIDNLRDQDPATLEHLRAQVTATLGSRPDGEPGAAVSAELSEEEKARLRALGYVH